MNKLTALIIVLSEGNSLLGRFSVAVHRLLEILKDAFSQAVFKLKFMLSVSALLLSSATP